MGLISITLVTRGISVYYLAIADMCDCHATGMKIIDGSKHCQCESACVEPKNDIYGGFEDEFAEFTKLCVAAYYAGFITVRILPLEWC